MGRVRVAAWFVSLAILTGCSGAGSTSDSATPVTSSAAGPREPLVRLQRVAMLEEPVALAVRPGDPALYIAEKGGRVVAIRDGTVDPTPVLDVSREVSLGGEQGLLGLAFSPDGGSLYVNFTDVDGDTRVVSYAMTDGRADPSSRREVLFVDQPYSNHNGGNLVFGPDGYLYIGLGDGGSGGDPHGNAQSLGTLLGKMLRIDPRPTDGTPYRIPADNPFVTTPGARPEIWAYGLRNPWRYSFDRATGDLWIGDVGQSAWEEVDRQPASSTGGENYGWNVWEGSHPYLADGSAPGAIDPVFDYSHSDGGCVVTGGFVYRGAAIPDLVGTYVFADFCMGGIQGLRFDGGEVVREQLGGTAGTISSFGEDADGELYVLSLVGWVYRVVPV
jgi:glucose/arabinose dehydrogenase